jgi:hypothetical protein
MGKQPQGLRESSVGDNEETTTGKPFSAWRVLAAQTMVGWKKSLAEGFLLNDT